MTRCVRRSVGAGTRATLRTTVPAEPRTRGRRAIGRRTRNPGWPTLVAVVVGLLWSLGFGVPVAVASAATTTTGLATTYGYDQSGPQSTTAPGCVAGRSGGVAYTPVPHEMSTHPERRTPRAYGRRFATNRFCDRWATTWNAC